MNIFNTVITILMHFSYFFRKVYFAPAATTANFIKPDISQLRHYAMIAGF